MYNARHVRVLLSCKYNTTARYMTRIVHLHRQVSTVELTVVSFLYKNALVMSSLFLKFVIVLTNSCRPILSLIILVINKSYFRPT